MREVAEAAGIECGLSERPNFTYTEEADRVSDIHAEVEAASAAGLPVAVHDGH